MGKAQKPRMPRSSLVKAYHEGDGFGPQGAGNVGPYTGLYLIIKHHVSLRCPGFWVPFSLKGPD